MVKSGYLTSGAVCDLLGISKTTLFRWEEEKKISPSKRVRVGVLEARVYTAEQVQTIARLWYARMKSLRSVSAEDKSRIKFFFDPESALAELSVLARQRKLTEDTLRMLFEQVLANHPLKNKIFSVIAIGLA